MENWQLFDDPRFSLQFKYPGLATNGEPVERVETEQAGMLRVHVLAPTSREVYFEVSKYESLSAESEYRRHKEYLPMQFDRLTMTGLEKTSCGSVPAYGYSFEWEQGSRNVLLVERGEATYRILYNARFRVNLQILSTLEWLNPP